MPRRHPDEARTSGPSISNGVARIGAGYACRPCRARSRCGPPADLTRRTEARIAERATKGKEAAPFPALADLLLPWGMTTTEPARAMTDPLRLAIAEIGGDDKLRAILTDVRKITGMRFAAIAYVSEDRWITSLVQDDLGLGLSPGDELDVSKTLCSEVRRYSCEILIDNVDNDPQWSSHPVPALYGFRSYLSLPVLVGTSVFGTLCALDREPRLRPLAEIRPRLYELAARSGQLLMERMRHRPDAASSLDPVNH